MVMEKSDNKKVEIREPNRHVGELREPKRPAVELREPKRPAVELLAPAGSFEGAVAAINAGADAIYIGGPFFGARAAADNPDEDGLKAVIDYAHLHGRAVYLTINTLLKESELEGLYQYLAPLYEHGLDAVIVQDAGVFRYVRRTFPGLLIHCSTQMTITGYHGASFWQQQGASRVVLARELSLEEIRSIRQKTDVEIECFVHGALCYCYSGQCLHSSFIGGRSGNRGRCAQPCRLKYQCGGTERYYLSPRDICTVDMIPDLVAAGISSFKIEGRMKRPEYSAGVTRIYRKYLDLYQEKGRAGFKVAAADMVELMDLYNRGGFTHGYMDAAVSRDELMAFDRPGHHGVQIGTVSRVAGERIFIRTGQPVQAGDILEIAGVVRERGSAADENRAYEFTVAKADQGGNKEHELILNSKDSRRFRKGQPVIRTNRQSLLAQLRKDYIEKQLKEKINGKLILKAGIPVTLIVEYKEICVPVTGAIPQPAKKQPLKEERVRETISRTGDAPFDFAVLDVEMDEDLFVPVQQLKSLRRQALEELMQHIYAEYRRPPVLMQRPLASQMADRDTDTRPRLHVSVEQITQVEALCFVAEIDILSLDLAFYDLDADEEQLQAAVKRIRAAGKECRIALPHIFREKYSGDAGIYEKLQRLQADALIVRNVDSLAYLKAHHFTGRILPDYTMYTFQPEAEQFWREAGAAGNTAPLELNRRELAARNVRGSELIVYGYIPVMITAGCLHQPCDRSGAEQYLRDRKKKSYRIRSCCTHCYNLMYYPEPLWLGDCLDEVAELGPAEVRIIGTTETAEQLGAIIEATAARLKGKRRPGEMNKRIVTAYTRGHFMRGTG